MRRLGVVVGLVVALAACKKGGEAEALKPIAERELWGQHVALGDIELDVKIPQGLLANEQPTQARWADATGDALTVEIAVATPTVLQNAVNAESQAERRVSRSEQSADGWIVTSHTADGSQLHSQRLIQRGQRAVLCKAAVTWKAPGHDPTRTAWLESICQSVSPTKFP